MPIVVASFENDVVSAAERSKALLGSDPIAEFTEGADGLDASDFLLAAPVAPADGSAPNYQVRGKVVPRDDERPLPTARGRVIMATGARVGVWA